MNAYCGIRAIWGRAEDRRKDKQAVGLVFSAGSMFRRLLLHNHAYPTRLNLLMNALADDFGQVAPLSPVLYAGLPAW